MFNQPIGLLMLALGCIFSFGAYRPFTEGSVKTITVFVAPLAHLIAGLGLLQLKGWGRYWAFFLAGFYLISGVLILGDTLSLIEFLPIVPLIPFIPASLIRWTHPTIFTVLVLLILPLLLMAYLSSRRAAVRFEPWLGGRFAWGAPFLIIWAAAFIFSYALLIPSELAFFVKQEERAVLGFQLSPLQGQILRYVEFYLPLVLALGLPSGSRIVFFLAILSALYYWAPFFLGDTKPAYLRDFQFMFFGISWALVAVILLLYHRFFFGHGLWLERRGTIRKSRTEAPIAETLKPIEARRTESGFFERFFKLGNRWFYLIISSILVVILGGGTWLFFFQNKPSEAGKTEKQLSLAVGTPSLRLEGISIDSQSAFAVIQGNIVQAGQAVQGYQVEAIEPNRVLLSKEGSRYWLDDQGRLQPTS